MLKENNINNLAIFGGDELFAIPKSTSNLLKPEIGRFFNYSRKLFEEKRCASEHPINNLLEQRLAEFHQTKYCVTFSTGFWGLVLAIRVLALKGKSEIIMPSLTYRRMPDMAAWLDLKPRFCEVDPRTLAMTPETVKPCISENTAIILGVHPIVNCCDASGLVGLAKEFEIPILFDSVESVYESTAAGRIGGFGEAECFSLHACKLLNGFGGGYLTTNNKKLAVKLSSMRNFGFDGDDGVGNCDGMNSKLNDIHAAMALASLDGIENQIELNRSRYYMYRKELDSVSGVRLLEFDENFQTSYKNIVVELLDGWPLSRKTTIQILNTENILARPHYYPALHSNFNRFPNVSAKLPLTEILAEKYINLPCGQLVSNDDIKKIVDFLKFISSNANSIINRMSKVVAHELQQ